MSVCVENGHASEERRDVDTACIRGYRSTERTVADGSRRYDRLGLGVKDGNSAAILARDIGERNSRGGSTREDREGGDEANSC